MKSHAASSRQPAAGVATVAVYSEADANARHVRLADEAVLIGPAAARESYLVGERILDVAKRTGRRRSIRATVSCPRMRISPKPAKGRDRLHRAASVSNSRDGFEVGCKVTDGEGGRSAYPGYHGDNQDPAFLAEQAARIGYPVLIKASAGGGGKGMRRVEAAVDFEAALASCKREAPTPSATNRC